MVLSIDCFCGALGKIREDHDESIWFHLCCEVPLQLVCMPIICPLIAYKQCCMIYRGKRAMNSYRVPPPRLGKRKRRLSLPLEDPSWIISSTAMSVVKQTTIDQTGSALCSKLPREVREMIYGYVFSRRRVHVKLGPGKKSQVIFHIGDNHSWDCEIYTRKQCTCNSTRRQDHSSKDGILSLLKTCRFM